jgi:hypothetical protein
VSASSADEAQGREVNGLDGMRARLLLRSTRTKDFTHVVEAHSLLRTQTRCLHTRKHHERPTAKKTAKKFELVFFDSPSHVALVSLRILSMPLLLICFIPPRSKFGSASNPRSIRHGSKRTNVGDEISMRNFSEGFMNLKGGA